MKFMKLNNRGFSHDLLVMLFVVIFAIVGVGYLVVSHADTVAYTSTNEFSKFQYALGTGTTAALTHSNTSNLLLQFNKGVTGYHASDTAMYRFNLPAATTASSLTMNVSYVDAGYDTVFVATGSPSNRVWSVSRASAQSNQTVTLSLANKPTVIYFGISARGSSGGFSGTFPANRNFTVNSYTLKGVTTTASTTPTVSLGASPTSVSSGGSSTLTWSSTNATSCTAGGGWSGSKATSGTASTGALSASSSYNLTCTGSNNTSANASTTVSVGAAGGGGGGAGGGGGGGGAGLTFNGTFSSVLSGGTGHGTANYSVVYADGNSLTMLSPTVEQFHVLGSVSLSGNEGHPRADLSTPNVYPANEATPLFTSITFQFPQGTTIPGANSAKTWLQLAEAKDTGAQHAGWSMGLGNYWSPDQKNHLQFGVTPSYYAPPIWDSGIAIDNNWHTLTVESNYGNSNNAWAKLWYDGNPVTFNEGPPKGTQQANGFSLINDGASSWPLDINLYMGPNLITASQTATINHGAPLIGTSLSAVTPPNGWTSSP
jgi:hypothetical protein